MFSKVRIQNFMNLHDVTVELGPLTIFVGPNSSGKSAFFKALTTFSRLLRYPVKGGRTGPFMLESGGITLDDVVTGQDSSRPIRFEIWTTDPPENSPDYLIELTRDHAGWGISREAFQTPQCKVDTKTYAYELETSAGLRSWQAPADAPLAYLTFPFRSDRIASGTVKDIQDFRDRLGNARRYRPSASDIADFVRTPASARPTSHQIQVNEAGRGLAIALRELLSTDRPAFQKIESELGKLHPHIFRINFKSDFRGVGLTYSTNRTQGDTPAALESDGVLLTTMLLWLIHTSGPHQILCLEEPENGIHLAAMRERYQLLKSFANVEQYQDPPQILLSTHSRDFLNAIGTEPKQASHSRSAIVNEVRIVEFGEDAGTQVHSLTSWHNISDLLNEVKDHMGDLWWSERLGPNKQQ